MSTCYDAASEFGRLGFIEIARRTFGFLLEGGFELALCEPTRLVFESREVRVSVYHGRSSYHVGLNLARLDDAGHQYSLHEVLAALAPTETAKARCQTTDSAVLERCLSGIADVVSRTCRLLLAGDERAFEDLRLRVAPKRAAITLEAQYGAILDRADQAWQGKEHQRARELYEKAKPALSETQRRRLVYLSRRLAAGTR